jgi:hypothetical protein
VPLPHFFPGLKTDDSLVLRIFGEAEFAAETRRVTGTAGFVGTLMIFFAILNVFWASLDPTVDIRPLFGYSIELLGGLGLALGFGFSFARKTDLNKEFQATILGLFSGISMIATQSAVYAISGLLPYSVNVTLILLAPVAETMLFTVAFYHLFRFHFPELGWLQIAATSDVSFAFYHYFAYGARPDFWIILVILLVGNTILMWVYHLTKNATAPMIGHFLVNAAVVGNEAVSAILPHVGTIVALFALFVLIYLFLGRFRSESY